MSGDLTSLFQPGDDQSNLKIFQGTVVAWNNETAENTISVAGGQLANVPSLIAETTALAAGDVVSLLSMGDRWLLLGKVTTPGDPDQVPTWNADLEALAPLTDLAAITAGTTITGATNVTSDPGDGAHVVINDPAYPGQIAAYSGNVNETVPALISPGAPDGLSGKLSLNGPELDVAGQHPQIDLITYSDSTRQIIEYGDQILAQALDFVRIAGGNRVEIGSDAGTGNRLVVTDNAVTEADLSSLTNTFPTFPHYYGYLNASQNIASGGGGTTITGWVDDGSPNSSGIADPAAGIWTVPTAGRYRLTAQGWWALIAAPAGARTFQWVQVAPNVVLASHTIPPSASAATPNRLEKTVRLAAGAQIFLRAVQTQGVAVNLVGSNPDLTYAQIEWVGP